MRRRAASRWGALCLLLLASGCDHFDPPPAGWRSDCPPPQQMAPLSLAAARQAHIAAERRHEIRLREAAAPGSFMRDMRAALAPEQLRSGAVCLGEVADRGELLFEHEYSFADGLGGGASRTAPRGPFRRVHEGAFGGPETIACPSCHWVGGPSGAGAETDNAVLTGDGAAMASGDARNPPPLLGVGVVQALAREMSNDLQRQRDALRRDGGRNGASREQRLVSKGVDFGVLRLGDDGALDFSAVQGVDADLVVKPFGWKGHFADIADFAADALQVHLGIQSDHLLSGDFAAARGTGADGRDPDGDGMRDELGPGPFAALVAHLALLEMPIVRPLVQDREIAPAATGLLPPTTTSFVADFARGRQLFHELGCAGCHVPMLVLERPVVEVEGLPPIDLTQAMREPAVTYDAALGGYPVWLFSDLKRHDMGPANAARHTQRGVPPEQYLTPRLWGVADSAPYLHDGRAPSFDYAIAGHDGEGVAARAAYAALDHHQKGDLRVYLMSLRRAPRVIVP